jgi:hypothetical protein
VFSGLSSIIEPIVEHDVGRGRAPRQEGVAVLTRLFIARP